MPAIQSKGLFKQSAQGSLAAEILFRVVRLTGSYDVAARSDKDSPVVPRTSTPGVQEFSTRRYLQSLVRSLSSYAVGLRHLRAASGGRNHQLSHRWRKTGFALRHGHGDQRHKE